MAMLHVRVAICSLFLTGFLEIVILVCLALALPVLGCLTLAGFFQFDISPLSSTGYTDCRWTDSVHFQCGCNAKRCLLRGYSDGGVANQSRLFDVSRLHFNPPKAFISSIRFSMVSEVCLMEAGLLIYSVSAFMGSDFFYQMRAVTLNVKLELGGFKCLPVQAPY